jgi:CRISPR-associated protein Cas5t
MMKQVLKVRIHQPDAHYRVPFSYRRRFTYPIPPYSTIKGLICNLMGIRDDKDAEFKKLQQGLSLAICGTFESIVKEYIWFRNLKNKRHIAKFNSATNRIMDGVPQHPGEQMPVTIDVLHNVDLSVYIYHPELMDKIKSAFENPSNRLSSLHLGRSEDWIVIKEIEKIPIGKYRLRHLSLFTWLPSLSDMDDEFVPDKESYKKFYEQANGNLFRLPTFYSITENNQRVFTKYIEVKLFEKGGFKAQEFYIDNSEMIPVFFAKMGDDK